MKNLILSLGLILGLTSFQAEAGIVDEAIDFVKGLIGKFSGETSKSDELKMPVIPKVVSNAKDVSGYKDDSDSDHDFYKKLSESQRKELSVGFVNELYQVVLGREPLYQEFQGKVSVLLQGGSREGVYRSLVLSDKYAGFEQTNTEPSEDVVTFTIQFLGEYLDASLEKEKLENFNFYTIKRFLIERCLETMDAFPSSQSIHSWFAFVSFGLESNKSVKWSQKHRKLGSKESYYAWGRGIPADILKSEVILKLHKVFNELQLR